MNRDEAGSTPVSSGDARLAKSAFHCNATGIDAGNVDATGDVDAVHTAQRQRSDVTGSNAQRRGRTKTSRA